MSGPLFDCYVLAPQRTAEIAIAFLERFLPARDAQFEPSDPSDVLGLPRGVSTQEIVSFLEANPDVAYSMYWRRRGGDTSLFAILAFTADAQLILGLSSCRDDDPECAQETLEEIIDAVGAEYGYAAVEAAPAASREDFLRRVEAQSVAGQLSARPRR
jgi:hypothetical protein